MQQLDHQELELSDDYEKQKILLQMIVTMQANLAILTFSFIVEHLTSLQVIHESVFLSIFVFIMLNFINYNRDCHQMTNKQLFSHPFPIITLGLGLIITLRIPGYSKMVSIVCFCGLVFNFYTASRKKFINCVDQIFFSLGQTVVSLVLLSLEEVITFDLRFILFIPLLVFLFLWVSENSFFIKQFLQNRVNRSQIFMSKERFIYLMVTVNTVTINIIALIIWSFINHEYLLPFFKITIVLNIFCVLIVVTLFQQILLMTTMPSLQTIFRVSQRRFIYKFTDSGNRFGGWRNPLSADFDKMQRNSNSNLTHHLNQALCVVCQLPATVIKTSCGHLTTCSACSKKLIQKQLYECIICKNASSGIFFLKPIRRWGYKRRFFIEKKLQVNQYVVGHNQF